MAIVNVFFAYQFAKARMARRNREAIYNGALEDSNLALEREGRALTLKWKFWGLESGASLTEEIFDRMDEAEIFVLDLSDENSNVLIELGYALAACRDGQKALILLVHKNYEISKLPSDIRGIVVLKVKQTKYLRQALAAEVATKAARLPRAPLMVRRMLSYGVIRTAHLICPELPEEARHQFANPIDRNYTRMMKFADADALLYLKGRLARFCPLMETCESTGSEPLDNNAALRFLIGGPAMNQLVESTQNLLPLRYVNPGPGRDWPLVENGGGTEFLPDVETGTLLSDIAFIARISHGRGRWTLMLSGTRSFGVLAAAKSLFEEQLAADNLEWLEEKMGDRDFVLAFKATMIAGSVVAQIFSDASILASYVKDSERWVKAGPR